MRTIHKTGLAAAAALASLTVGSIPASAAQAPAPTRNLEKAIITFVDVGEAGITAPCKNGKQAITRWGHTGYKSCHKYTVMDVDWDGNDTRDETFVIAPNREIWHIWAKAGGWKEMPGNGRADTFRGVAKSGKLRCVEVNVKGAGIWGNVFNGSKWLGWVNKRC